MTFIVSYISATIMMIDSINSHLNNPAYTNNNVNGSNNNITSLDDSDNDIENNSLQTNVYRYPVEQHSDLVIYHKNNQYHVHKVVVAGM